MTYLHILYPTVQWITEYVGEDMRTNFKNGDLEDICRQYRLKTKYLQDTTKGKVQQQKKSIKLQTVSEVSRPPPQWAKKRGSVHNNFPGLLDPTSMTSLSFLIFLIMIRKLGVTSK